MAILAIIFAFVFSPLGIVFGVMGRRQIRESGQEGRGLATAGLVLGSIFTGLAIVYVVVLVIFLGAIASSS